MRATRVVALARRQFGDQLKAGVALPVELEDPRGRGKERLERVMSLRTSSIRTA